MGDLRDGYAQAKPGYVPAPQVLEPEQRVVGFVVAGDDEDDASAAAGAGGFGGGGSGGGGGGGAAPWTLANTALAVPSLYAAAAAAGGDGGGDGDGGDPEDALYRSLYIASDYKVSQPPREPKALDPELDPELAGTLPIVAARIVDSDRRAYAAGERFVDYCVEVHFGANSHQVWHRYSAFRVLHRKLAQRFGKHAVPAMTGKKIAKFSAAMIARRIEKLNAFLEGIVQNELLQNSDEFRQFCSMDEALRAAFASAGLEVEEED